jgi:hypothetical protein
MTQLDTKLYKKTSNLSAARFMRSYGAGDGNRTHATSLEGWGSTIELHPHCKDIRETMVGKTGFEPATPWSQAKYSTKLSYFPN